MHLEQKGASLKKKGLRLQPHVVALANNAQLGAQSAYYACLHSDVFYSTTSLMEAVDICVKSAFVFGVDYPAAAQSSWLFLQRAVYGITSKYDRMSSRVLELVTDTNSTD